MTPMLLWGVLGLSWAGELGGVPVEGHDLLEAVVFGDRAAGWSAAIADPAGGGVRGFSGREDGEAEVWLARVLDEAPTGTRRALGNSEAIRCAVARATLDCAQEAWVIGDRWVAWRDGASAMVVRRPGGGALALARQLWGTRLEASPWPAVPEVEVDGQRVVVSGSWTHVSYHPGLALGPSGLPQAVYAIPLGDTVSLSAVPSTLRVVAWDAQGRAVEAVWQRSRPPEAPEASAVPVDAP